jgi:hypothetical protein
MFTNRNRKRDNTKSWILANLYSSKISPDARQVVSYSLPTRFESRDVENYCKSIRDWEDNLED